MNHYLHQNSILYIELPSQTRIYFVVLPHLVFSGVKFWNTGLNIINPGMSAPSPFLNIFRSFGSDTRNPDAGRNNCAFGEAGGGSLQIVRLGYSVASSIDGRSIPTCRLRKAAIYSAHIGRLDLSVP